MAILVKGVDFTTGDQVTATNFDNLVDLATFASGAVDNSTTQLSGGAIIVKDGGITSAKLATNIAISGTLSGAAVAFTTANNINNSFIAGTRAIRLWGDATNYNIEGVDVTLVAAYHPLNIGGSAVNITISGTAVAAFSSTGLSVTGTFAASGATNLDAGTVSLPGLYLEGETTTGLYRIGANNHGYAVSAAKVLDIASTGLAVTGTHTVSSTVIHTLSATPASAAAAGTVGTISWDASYIYICTATNTWKRVAIATWP